MLLEPRNQVLDIWRWTINYSWRGGKWHWGARVGRNSISDAEQLLCILYPATNVPALRFDRPDLSAEDVLDALRVLGAGNDLEIAKVFVGILTEYMERYRDAEGRPTFTGDTYLEPEWPDQADDGPSPAQLDMEIVDSFSMSITLALATLGFLQVLKEGVGNARLLDQIEHLRLLTSNRLTAAMTGLMRSFSVHVFEVDSEPGRNLMSMVNQDHEPERIVADRLSRTLDGVRGRLQQELSVGSGQVATQLQNPARLFECGWSWGVVTGAEQVSYTTDVAAQPLGVAEDRPYLYFTSVALDGIEDLFSPRTRILGLLDDTQLRLAQSLQLRWELALGFWTQVATFGADRLPVEDIPWRTSDGAESEYYSLFVASMVVQRLTQGSADDASTQTVLLRMGRVFEDLARRGRITARPASNDAAALSLHVPGNRLRLMGSEVLGPRRAWVVSSYASLLLKRAIRVAGLMEQTSDRDRLLRLSNSLWTHLLERRLGTGDGAGLWDQPGRALPIDKPFAEPSWYHTQRVVECLVSAAIILDAPPRVSPELMSLAYEYLTEAEHLFDQEKLKGTPATGHAIRETFQAGEPKLARARELASSRPGTAISLVQEVLRDLDALAVARTRRPPGAL